MPCSLRRPVVVAALSALAAAGCGGGSTTNGLEKKTPTQVTQAAVAALKAAKSVRLVGETREGGRLLKIDFRFQGPDTAGTMARDGERAEIVKVGGTTYLKADRRFYQSAGGGAAADLVADRWVKLASGGAKQFEELTLDSFAKDIGKEPTTGKVERTTLAGRKAVLITQRNGTRLWVADVGAEYPLRAEKPGADGGHVDFTDYGADFRIAAPRDAVDLGARR